MLPIVFGVFETINTQLPTWLKKIGRNANIEQLQRSASLQSARLLKHDQWINVTWVRWFWAVDTFRHTTQRKHFNEEHEMVMTFRTWLKKQRYEFCICFACISYCCCLCPRLYHLYVLVFFVLCCVLSPFDIYLHTHVDTHIYI